MTDTSRSTFVVVLLRRFLRSLPWKRAALPVAFALLVLTASNVVLDGQTLSPRQAAQSQIGHAAGQFRFAEGLPYGSESVASEQTRASVDRLGAELVVRAFDFPLGNLPDGVEYVEAPWPGQMGDNYALSSGRMPRTEGEVVLVNFDGGIGSVGDSLDVLGGPGATTVVGIAQGSFSRHTSVLAGPGTWSVLGGEASPELAQISGQVSLLFPQPTSAEDAASAARGVGEAIFPNGTSTDGAFVTATDVAADAPRPWIDRSPILFWFPGLALIAAATFMTYAGMSRTLVPAISSMRDTGVATSTAITAPWLAVLVALLPAAVAGWAAGWFTGWLAARLASTRWGAPSPEMSWPLEAAFIGIVSIAFGAAAAWFSLQNRVQPRPVRNRTAAEDSSPSRAIPVASTALGCVAVYLLFSMRSPWQMLGFVCVCVAWAALAARRATKTAASTLRPSGLSTRLVKRLISAYLPRTATFVAVITLGVGLSTAIAISVQSAVAAERIAQGSTAPAGFVALDNDGAPSLAVPKEVTAAAERVDALREQTPTQIWTTGRQVSHQGRIDVTGALTLVDGIVPVFAVETPEDFEVLAGVELEPSQVNLLLHGGVLVIDQTEGIVREDSVRLRTSDEAARAFPAEVVEVRPAPWLVSVPGIMLVKTAEQAGVPVSPGARVYHGVSQGDAAQVQQELALAGIHPENAEIPYRLPPVLPDMALVVGCAAVFLMIVGVASLLARSQVQGMKAWVDQLRRIGVPASWARRALLGQYVILMFVGLALGAAAGLASVLVAKVRLPALVIEVPWSIVTMGAAATLIACLSSVVLALRMLGRADPVARSVGFE